MSIGREVGCSTGTYTSLRTQFINIQGSNSKTHDAVMLQTSIFNLVLQSISVCPRSQPCVKDELSSIQCDLGSEVWYNQYTKHESLLNSPACHNCAVSGPSLSPMSVTPFEASGNSFPELYNTDAQVLILCLAVIDSSEQLTWADSKTNAYSGTSIGLPYQYNYLAHLLTRLIQRPRNKTNVENGKLQIPLQLPSCHIRCSR